MKFYRKTFLTRQVLPVLSVRDCIDRVSIYSQVSCNDDLSLATFQPVDSFSGLIFRQLTRVYSAATGLNFWFIERFILSALRPFVSLIVFGSAKKEVVGVYAWRVVACMANLQLPGVAFVNAVRQAGRAIGAPSKFHRTVSVFVAMSGPKPAPVRTFKFPQKPGEFFLVWLWNVEVMHSSSLPQNLYNMEVYSG
jgi:hypothetical protein